ncbi:NAD(P)H:quinone oxidoreductase [Solwaraspora sp. WMMD791]|uniref:NAD(P)H:quinone oxidoreductase n=1 Tax=Solwaraspora sp. WMMD791 TaxID=3016086 RepID=UPI00249B2FAE|nr:NAD(P)H:quinone oxidoreductase [Solwaraspora sp. WMMD791]WFE26113.1 NAD(P)H:quinone oxidoreductase [Solwaraspora sp. WMMD791]
MTFTVNPNVSVVYYSATGTVAEIAREIALWAEKAGAAVRLRRINELAPRSVIEANPRWSAHAAATVDVPVATAEDLLWADAVLMGTPTRFGNMATELKHFIDSLGGAWRRGLLADKVYSAFTASSSPHGGQESTLLALTTSFYHFGGIVVAPGYTDAHKHADGNPYGTSYCTQGGRRSIDDVTRQAARVQAERVVTMSRRLCLSNPVAPCQGEGTR